MYCKITNWALQIGFYAFYPEFLTVNEIKQGKLPASLKHICPYHVSVL